MSHSHIHFLHTLESFSPNEVNAFPFRPHSIRFAWIRILFSFRQGHCYMFMYNVHIYQFIRFVRVCACFSTLYWLESSRFTLKISFCWFVFRTVEKHTLKIHNIFCFHFTSHRMPFPFTLQASGFTFSHLMCEALFLACTFKNKQRKFSAYLFCTDRSCTIFSNQYFWVKWQLGYSPLFHLRSTNVWCAAADRLKFRFVFIFFIWL